MLRPVAVICSDVHYSLPTLELADKAMRMAIDHAKNLSVPLIVAGDLHDTKAQLRAECVNTMIKTFEEAERVIILRGNHDQINEKSKEHALNFLKPFAHIVNETEHQYWAHEVTGAYFIPYHHDPSELRAYLKTLPPKSTLIMHQGITGSNSGEYIQDHSAITPKDVACHRVISGHYHQHQTIALPKGGSWTYIGNPYSLSFGEAYDPPKGFLVLFDDGSIEHIPTKLRKHVIIKYNADTQQSDWSSGPIMAGGGVNDLVWLKVTGQSDTLAKLSKEKLVKKLDLPSNIRIDFTATDETRLLEKNQKEIPKEELFDSIIDSLYDVDNTRKNRLKVMWKKFY